MSSRIFLPRYSTWWDKTFEDIGMDASEKLVTISQMRWAKLNKETNRVELDWSNEKSASAIGRSASAASRAKTKLADAGLIILIRHGKKRGLPDLYDVTRLAQDTPPAKLRGVA